MYMSRRSRLADAAPKTRLAVGHDRRVAAIKNALDELLRRVRIYMILRRRLVEDHIKFEGLLVVGRLESELVLLAGRRARRSVREGSDADGDAHAFARRRGCGFFRRGAGRVWCRGRVLRAWLLFSHLRFARLVWRGGAAADVLVIVERCEKA